MSVLSREERALLIGSLRGAAGAIPFAEAVASQLLGRTGSHRRASAACRVRVLQLIPQVLLGASAETGAEGEALARELLRNPELASSMFQNLDLLYGRGFPHADTVAAALMRVLELAPRHSPAYEASPCA